MTDTAELKHQTFTSPDALCRFVNTYRFRIEKLIFSEGQFLLLYWE